jgi:LysM repeat protein
MEHHMPRSHRTASPGSGTSAAEPTTSAPQAQAEESSGFFGFLEQTGRAIGDGFDSAVDRAGGWVDSAGEAVDELSTQAGKWGRTAGEAADLDYDLGWGSVAATGTLSDILEIGVAAEAIPPDLLRILEGATASNVVSLRYDYSGGALTLEAPDLQVRGVLVSGMQVGTANLTGVTIRVQSDQIEIIGSERQGSQAELRAARCEALDVRYETADGPMQASRLMLSGLVLRASSREGQVLEGDVTGSIQADEAGVEGFSGAGVTLEEGRIGGLSAELSEGGERAGVRLGRIDATGVTQGGVSLGNAAAEGVEIDVTNQDGGLPMLDERADHLGANVRLRAASVREFSHPMASLQEGTLEQAMIAYGEQGTTGSVAGLRASGLDTEWADADGIDVDDVALRMDDSGISAGVEGITATGLRSEQGGAAGVTASDVRFRQGADGSTASVGEVRADGIDAAAADARTVSARALEAAWAGEGDALTANARVGSLRAAGVTSDQGSVDSVTLGGATFATAGGRNTAGIDGIEVRGASSASGGADRATVGRTDASWSGSGDALAAEATVGGITAEGVESAYADVASVTADPLSISLADGHTRVRTDHLGASGVTGADVSARSLDVNGVSADLGPNGTVRAGAGQVDAEALAAYGATVGRARLTGAEIGMDEAGTQVGLAGLDVSAARYGDVAAADRLTANDARIGIRSADDLDATLGDFRIQGLDASNFSAGDVRGAGIGVDMDHGRTEARVASASLADATVADRVDVASGSVAGVTAAVTGSDVRDVSLRSASVQDVRDRVTGSTAQSAELGGVRYTNSPDTMRASVDRLGLTGARFDSGNIPASEGGASSGGPALDMDALIRSASRRVDDADVSFDVGVNPMESFFADIHPDTRARGRVTARDNQLTDVNVGLSNPVDGPLWIEGNGVYTDDKGRLRADLSGWFDHKIGGFANDALGVEGNRLPSIGQVGQGVAGMMSAPASPSEQAGASPVDLSSSRVMGTVGLSPGRIEAGAGRVDLAQQRAGDNVVQFDSQHGRDMAVAFSRILASGISADTGASRVATGQASVSGASVQAHVGDDASRVRGEVGAVNVAGLQYQGAGMAKPFTPTPRSSAPATSSRPMPRPAGPATAGASRPMPRPAEPATAAPAAGTATYTVRSGDTLGAIARRAGTTVAAIAAANGIADPNRINVGQVLRLP